MIRHESHTNTLIALSVFVAAFTMGGCSKKFEGENNTGPVKSEPPQLAKQQNSVPASSSPPTASPVPQCTATLNYNPLEIRCSLGQKANTVWNSVPSFVARTDLLFNKAAMWISPLDTVTSGGFQRCPFVPNSDKLVFVTNFNNSIRQDITVEGVIDDVGTARLLKGGSFKNPINLADQNAPNFSRTVTLEPGTYTLVVEALDQGQVATGAVISVLDQQRTVLRQSEPNTKNWCIFRIQSQQLNVDTFLGQAAICQPCFTGVMP
jgi:hypothetical protein